MNVRSSVFRRAAVSLLCAGIVAAISFPGALSLWSQAAAPDIVRGDVDLDGSVTATDALAVLSAVVGRELPDHYRILPNGDADGDGQITAVDALVILAFAVGRDMPQYPVGDVLPSLVIDEDDPLEVVVGTAHQLTVHLAGLADTTILWSTSNPQALEVDGTGRVVGFLEGSQAVVTAVARADSTVRDSITVRILAPEVTGLTVTPDTATLAIGDTLRLRLQASYSNGQSGPTPYAEWTSSDTTVARVRGDGVVTATGAGRVHLTARSGGRQVVATVEVHLAFGVVGAGGGSVMSRGDSVQVVIPAGALSSDQVIVVTRAGDAPSSPTLVDRLALHLQPSGVVFTSPVEMNLTYDPAWLPGAGEEDLRIYRLEGEVWVELEDTWVDTGTRTVHGSIEQLGTYAVLARPAVTRVQVHPNILTLEAGSNSTLQATIQEASPNVRSHHPIHWSSTDTTLATVSAAGVVNARRTGEVRIVAHVGSQADTAIITIGAGEFASFVQAAGNGQLGEVGAPLSDSLVVRALDPFGNGVPGVEVTWTITAGGGSTSSTTTETDESGRSRVQWTLGSMQGLNSVAAAVAGHDPLQFTATGVPAAPARITVLTQPGEMIRAGEPFSPSPVVQIADEYGNPVREAGRTVAVEIESGGGALAGTLNVPTDSAGRAAFQDLKIRGTVGPRVLRFTSAGLVPATSAPILVTVGVPDSMMVAAGDLQTTAVGSPLPVNPAVLVVDASGNPVPGINVTFEIASGGGSLADSSPQIRTTDASGIATASSWVMGTTAGSNALQATVPNVGTITFTAMAEAGAADVATSTLAADTTWLTADGSSTAIFTVQLNDSHGNALTSGGDDVTFSTTGGTFSGVGDNGDGRYTATLTAPTSIGSATISAALDGTPFDSTVVVQFTAGAPIGYEVIIGADSIVAGDTVPVTAQLLDANDNPVAIADILVTWTSSGGGSFVQPTSLTNSQGIAEALFIASTSADSVNLVTVQDATGVSGSSPGVVSRAGGPVNIVRNALHGDTLVAGSEVPGPPAVRITDPHGNPVAGLQVVFSITAGSGAVTDSVQVTGSDGWAAIGSWTLGASVGSNTLTASAGDLSISFTVFGSTGPASASTSGISVANESLTEGTSTKVTVRVRDAAGNSRGTGDDDVVILALPVGQDSLEIGPITDLGDGSYTALLTHIGATGTVHVSASVNSVALDSIAEILFRSGGTQRSWTGLESADWSTRANWDPFGIPARNDTIIITGVGAQPVISDGDKQVRRLEMMAGTPTLDLGGHVLLVSGDILAEAGNVTNGVVEMSGTNASLLGTMPALRVSGSVYTSGETRVDGTLHIRDGIMTVTDRPLVITGQ